jgi:hypothetical protein
LHEEQVSAYVVAQEGVEAWGRWVKPAVMGSRAATEGGPYVSLRRGRPHTAQFSDKEG